MPTMVLNMKMLVLKNFVIIIKSINHNFSAPKTHQHSGVVQRKNRTMVYITKTILIDSNLPKHSWVETVNITFYITNR